MLVVLQMGISKFIWNLVFWAVVLAMKLPFDYWVILKPLKNPVFALWNIHWLNSGSGHIIINGWNTHVPKPNGDFILVAAYILPSLLIVFVDTGIFYLVRRGTLDLHAL